MKSTPKSLLLEKELKNLFLPVIRQRGKRYARNGRVRIDELEPGLIRSSVKGTIDYSVTVSLDESDSGRVRIGCTCPFFRQGIPCKHVWATICVADQLMAHLPDRRGQAENSILDIDRIFEQDLWNACPRKPPWKPLQDFVIKYSLAVQEHRLSISVFEQYIKKDGGPGRTRQISKNTMERPDLPRQDKLLLPFLTDLAEKAAFYSGFNRFGGNTLALDAIPLRPAEAGTILPMLAETGRLQVIFENNSIITDPLRLPSSPRARIEIKAAATGKNKIAMEPQIRLTYEKHEGKVGFNDVKFLNSSPVFFIFKDLLYEFDGPSYSWVSQVRGKGLPEIEREALPRLVKRASSISKTPVVKLPEELAPEKIRAIKPALHLTLDIGRDKVIAKARMAYEDYRIEPDSMEPVIRDYEGWRILERDIKEEGRLLRLLAESGFRLDEKQGHHELPLERASDVLSLLEKKGVALEAKDRKKFRIGAIRAFSVTSGIDWFDMDAEISFGDETVPLPKIVRAYLKGEKTITLSSGDVGILPTRWLQQHNKAFEFADMTGKTGKKTSVRFSMSHALIIDQMLQEAAEVKVDKRFEGIREKIRYFKGIRARETPPAFRGRLRGYQKEALGWFRFLEELGLGGILADDMGLGKTVQVLAWLAEKTQPGKNIPSLVVAPTSLVFNWQAEAEKFTPGLRISPYLGPRRHKTMDDCLNADIILTTYGILRRDIARISELKFNYAILDESQCIKNPDSVVSKAVRLIHARNKLCLTGTPMENHIGELWSQMEFLNSGMLGTRTRFMKRFARPLSHGEKDVISSLGQIVKPFILRRTKEEVAGDLPSKQETVIRCTMTPEQEKLYLRVRDHYRTTIMKAVADRGIKRSKIKVLEGLLRLRQAANHPALIGTRDVQSGKFIQLMDLLEEAVEGGHKVLVFSQFTRMLGIIKQQIAEKGFTFEYLDGRTPQAHREKKVVNFQENGAVKLFLISLRAGGIGLNLTAADYVFIVDPWWNPAVELQAIDRTHRIGQTRKVVTYRLISRDTVEEKVLRLQKKKQEIVGSILSGSRNMLSSLSSEDLEILFS